MTDKELHKLSRRELLQLLLTQAKDTEELRRLLEEREDQLENLRENYERLKKRLDAKDAQIRDLRVALHQERANRRIELEEAGSIAEAALRLNGIFEMAQKAAEQYLYNIRLMHEKETAYAEELFEKSAQELFEKHGPETVEDTEAAKPSDEPELTACGKPEAWEVNSDGMDMEYLRECAAEPRMENQEKGMTGPDTAEEVPEQGTVEQEGDMPDSATENPEGEGPEPKSENPEESAPDLEAEQPEESVPDLEAERPEESALDLKAEQPEESAPDLEAENPEKLTPDPEKRERWFRGGKKRVKYRK